MKAEIALTGPSPRVAIIPHVENGRPRRYYRITKTGRALLAKDRAEWRELSQAVTAILEGA